MKGYGRARGKSYAQERARRSAIGRHWRDVKAAQAMTDTLPPDELGPEKLHSPQDVLAIILSQEDAPDFEGD